MTVLPSCFPYATAVTVASFAVRVVAITSSKGIFGTGEKKVHAEYLLRASRRFRNAADRDRAGVRRVDRVTRHERLDLAEHAMLEIEVLEHRFDHQVDVAKASVLRRAAGKRHHVVELLTRDLFFQVSILHYLAHRDDSPADPSGVGVFEPDERAVLHRDRRDARAHEARAKHTQLVDRVRCGRGRGNTRVFLERIGREEQKDELT